jgi:hypothetical protein
MVAKIKIAADEGDLKLLDKVDRNGDLFYRKMI